MNRATKILLLSVFFLMGFIISGWAQQRQSDSKYVHPSFTLDQWTVEDGLPVNSVNDILQTKDGYIWLATFDGLVRFDGVRFKVYKSSDYPNLPSNRIHRIAKSEDDVIWLHLENNQLVKFSNEKFEPINTSNGLNGDQVFCAYEPENSNVLLFCTSNGLTQYKEGKLSAYLPNEIVGPITYLYINNEKVFWYKKGDDHNLYRYDGDSTTYLGSSMELTINTPVLTLYDGSTLFSTIGHIYRYRDGEINELALDLPPDFVALDFYRGDMFYNGFEKGEVLVPTLEHGLYKLLGDSLIVLKKDYKGNPNAILEEGDNSLWLMGEKQILNNGRLVFYFEDDTRQKAFDHEGSFWFGSQSSGLLRLKPNTFSIYSEREGLPDKNIYPVYQASDSSIWAGTHGHGISRLKDGKVDNYMVVTPGGGYIRSILETSNGDILVGTLNKGIFKFQESTNSFVKMPSPEQQAYLVRIFTIDALFEDYKKQLWAGTTHGLYQLPKDSTEWIRIPSEVSNPRHSVRYFAEAPDSSIWMATAGGGIRHFKNGKFTGYNSISGLSSNRVRSLFVDSVSGRSDYVLWVGTEDNGLNRIEVKESTPDTGKIVVYNNDNGLYENVVHQILEDDEGRLWMSGNQGIYWVSKKQLNEFAEGKISRINSTSYTEQDGLRNREANGGVQPAGTKTFDGRISFPTQDGVVFVDPKNISQNEIPPPIQIEEISSMNEEISLSGKGEIKLEANQRDFEINYTGLSFLVPEKVEFKYRLKGFNDQWVEAGARRTAFFTNVPAGEYEFEVLAANNAGIWAENPASQSIVVAPFFYETRWFYITVILFGGLAVWGTILMRTKNLKRRQKELEQSVRERTEEIHQQKVVIEKQAESQKRFFTNVSHELRTPLTLTIGPLEDLNGDKLDLQEQAKSKISMALRNSKRLLSLVSQILDISRLEASENKLKVAKGDLSLFIKAIAQNFYSLASRKDIQFDIQTGNAVEAWFNQDQIEKVITNLLSNAFKFTPNGERISIQVDEVHKEKVSITVSDTGMGIPQEELSHIFDRFFQSKNSHSRLQHGTGIGLALVKQLVELHGGRISANSTLGKGTTFNVILPVNAHKLPHAIVEDHSSGTASRPAIYVDGEDISSFENISQLDQQDCKTILIIEDNSELRQFVAGHLNEKYKVIEAIHGKQGLEKANEYLPDIIICDVMMPEMDGFEFVEKLRKDDSVNFIPVIMLTGKDTKEDTLKGLEFGANDYIVKPFDMDELKARIKSTLRSQKLLKTKFAAESSIIKVDKEKLKSADQKFIEQVQETILQNIEDPSFSVEKLAEMVNVGRSTLHRKLTTIAGETPVQLIRQLRLEQGKQMIENKAGNISEIAYSVGFESISWFSKCFKERYNVSPSELLS